MCGNSPHLPSGSPSFEQQIGRAKRREKSKEKDRPTEKSAETARPSERVLAVVAEAYCTPQLLTVADPTAVLAETRQLAAHLLRKESKLPTTEIGSILNLPTEEVYNLLGKVSVRLEDDREFGRRLATIRSRL